MTTPPPPPPVTCRHCGVPLFPSERWGWVDHMGRAYDPLVYRRHEPAPASG